MTSIEPMYHTHVSLSKLAENHPVIKEFIDKNKCFISIKCMACARVTVDRILESSGFEDALKSFIYLTTDGRASVNLYQRKGVTLLKRDMLPIQRKIQMQLRHQFVSCFTEHAAYGNTEFRCKVCNTVHAVASVPVLYRADTDKILLQEAVCPNCRTTIDLHIVRDSYDGVKEPFCFMRTIATTLS